MSNTIFVAKSDNFKKDERGEGFFHHRKVELLTIRIASLLAMARPLPRESECVGAMTRLDRKPL